MTSLSIFFLTLPYVFYFDKLSPWSKSCVKSISDSSGFVYIRFNKNPKKFKFEF